MAQQPIILPSKKVRRHQVTLNLPGAAITPSAQPVDTYYRTNVPKPAPTEALQIAQALAPFSKSLGQYLEFEKGYLQKEASAQAELDVQNWSTEQLTAVATMSREDLIESGLANAESGARPDYFVTAKLNTGKRRMQIGMEDLIKRYGEIEGDLTDPNGAADIETQMSDLRKEFMGQFEEMGFYIQQGASAILDPQIDHLRKKAISSRTTRREDENVENLTVGLSDAYGALVANGADIEEDERVAFYEQVAKQMELFVATGGENPNDISFEALERQALHLAEEHPGEDHAVELLKLAETDLGPGSTKDTAVPLAAPGTKNYDRLLKLREKIEEKAERHQDKKDQDFWANDRRANENAGDLIAKYYNDLESYEKDDSLPKPDISETEAGIITTFTDLDLDELAAQDQIREFRDSLETAAEPETNPTIFANLLEQLEKGELPDILRHFQDKELSQSDFSLLYQLKKENEKTPERNTERKGVAKVLVENLLGGQPPGAWERDDWAVLGPAVTAIQAQMEAEAKPARKTPEDWTRYLEKWGNPALAEVVNFRTTHKDTLDNVKGRMPSNIKVDALVSEARNHFENSVVRGVGEVGDFESPALFQKALNEARNNAGRVWDSEVNKVVSEVLQRATRVSTSDIPGAVVTELRERSKDMYALAVGDPVTMVTGSATGSHSDPLIFPAPAQSPDERLTSIDRKGELIGEDYNIGGSQDFIGTYDSVEMEENARWRLESVTLNLTDETNFNEKLEVAADNRSQHIAWIKGLNFWLRTGRSHKAYNTHKDWYWFGDYKISLLPRGTSLTYSGWSVARLPTTRSGIMGQYKALLVNIGIPYNDIAEDGFSKGLSFGVDPGDRGLKRSDIDLGQMPLDMGVDMDPRRSRAALDSALTEYKDTLAAGEDPRDTTLGKFMTALKIPMFYTDRNGDKKTHAELIVQRQKILWGSRF